MWKFINANLVKGLGQLARGICLTLGLTIGYAFAADIKLPQANSPEESSRNYAKSSVADTFEINMRFAVKNAVKTVGLKTSCTALSDVELEKFRTQFYFGKGLGNEAPTCLVRSLNVTLNGVAQHVPSAVVQLFADGPIFSTVNSAGTKNVFMLIFKGGSGTGTYEARLSFRNNRLVKRQVWGLEPGQSKFKHMVSEFK